MGCRSNRNIRFTLLFRDSGVYSLHVLLVSTNHYVSACIVLGVAIFQKNTKIWLTALCFSIPGTLLAAFHYALQKLPALQSSVAECTSEVPCTAQYVNYFGFITIPFLSLIAFLIITLLSFLLMKRSKEIQS